MSGLGARLSGLELEQLLDHLWAVDQRAEDAGVWPTPLCIWGAHGIGKTMLVEQAARRRGMRFACCAPAQFEEMGDLHGMPVVSPDGTTSFAPPSWVPREPGPGVLLLDDLNRADDRILRGLMQLLQTGALLSWRLPPGWRIVATANPENADYSVTPMDDAMLTRMRHASMVFDVQSWAAWARAEGLDPRGIEFVLGYPEIAVGRRTTPRSLAAFFRALEGVSDLGGQRPLVQTLGLSSLDESTVAAFLSFLDEGVARLPSAAQILDAADMDEVFSLLRALSPASGPVKVDRLRTVCDRLIEHLLSPGYAPSALHDRNLLRFLIEAPMPSDLKLTLHRELVARGNDALRSTISSPQLAKKLLLGA